MNDLFATIEEAKDERQAIQMADGITTTADDLHRCEVMCIVNRYFPSVYTNESAKEAGSEIARYCQSTAKHRGQAAADNLLADCRKEWAKRKEGK